MRLPWIEGYSITSGVLLILAPALFFAPILAAHRDPGQSEAMGYVWALLLPLVVGSIVVSVVLSVLAIRKGQRSVLQYATLAIGVLAAIWPLVLLADEAGLM